MKTKILIIAVLSVLIASITGKAQYYNSDDALGLPGDNLNLFATLKIFQESETLEIFEQKLNDQNNNINNLDLNGDNKIDYIRIFDNVDGNVHLITLRVAINKYENQDVAVFVVEKDNDKIHIQVIGDEDLYGKDYIIEPNMNDNNSYTPNPGYNGNNNYSGNNTIIINHYNDRDIISWPVIQYIYKPIYKPWYSPWYWDYYPSYWHTWNPYYWHYYWGYHYHWYGYYYGHYRHYNHYRYARWNDYYYNHRRTKSAIYISRRDRGEFKSTYSRPDLAKEGSDIYKKRFPKSSSSTDRIPDLKKPGNERILNPYENRRNSNSNLKYDNKEFNKPNHNNTNYTPVNEQKKSRNTNRSEEINKNNNFNNPKINTNNTYNRTNNLNIKDKSNNKIEIKDNSKNDRQNKPVRNNNYTPNNRQPVNNDKSNSENNRTRIKQQNEQKQIKPDKRR